MVGIRGGREGGEMMTDQLEKHKAPPPPFPPITPSITAALVMPHMPLLIPPCQLQNETRAECGIVHHLQYFTHPPDHARPKNQQKDVNCSKIFQIGIFRRHCQWQLSGMHQTLLFIPNWCRHTFLTSWMCIYGALTFQFETFEFHWNVQSWPRNFTRLLQGLFSVQNFLPFLLWNWRYFTLEIKKYDFRIEEI